MEVLLLKKTRYEEDLEFEVSRLQKSLQETDKAVWTAISEATKYLQDKRELQDDLWVAQYKRASLTSWLKFAGVVIVVQSLILIF